MKRGAEIEERKKRQDRVGLHPCEYQPISATFGRRGRGTGTSKRKRRDRGRERRNDSGSEGSSLPFPDLVNLPADLGLAGGDVGIALDDGSDFLPEALTGRDGVFLGEHEIAEVGGREERVRRLDGVEVVHALLIRESNEGDVSLMRREGDTYWKTKRGSDAPAP